MADDYPSGLKDFAGLMDKYPQLKELLQMPTRAGELKYVSRWEGCTVESLADAFGSNNLCISVKDLETLLKSIDKSGGKE